MIESGFEKEQRERTEMFARWDVDSALFKAGIGKTRKEDIALVNAAQNKYNSLVDGGIKRGNLGLRAGLGERLRVGDAAGSVLGRGDRRGGRALRPGVARGVVVDEVARVRDGEACGQRGFPVLATGDVIDLRLDGDVVRRRGVPADVEDRFCPSIA